MAVLNPTLNLYGYDQNCRNNKQWYITAQVIVYELTKTLDDSFAKCLNELYHFKYRGNTSRLVSYNQNIPVRNLFPGAFPHYGLAGSVGLLQPRR